MRRFSILFSLPVFLLSSAAWAQDVRPVFPMENGIRLNYSHHNSSDEHDANCTITVRNVTGDIDNGHIELVYNAFDEEGKPYFDGRNEFLMTIERIDGQTYITMDKMTKTLKIADLISAGDVSTIRVPMTVGEKLPDTRIFTTLGIFKATLTISDKSVLDQKKIMMDGKSLDCWLVHEKILTKTPFGTDTATADTWYAEGIGCVSQTVYDEKGKLKGRLSSTNQNLSDAK